MGRCPGVHGAHARSQCPPLVIVGPGWHWPRLTESVPDGACAVCGGKPAAGGPPLSVHSKRVRGGWRH